MPGTTTLILGAGIGGLATAFELRRRLDSDHRVVVVDREAEHRFQASFLWLMMSWREPTDISRPLAGLTAHGIDFRRASIERIDTQTQRVDTGTETIDYDYLVIALGSQLAADQIPGLAQAGLTPYSMDGATALRDAWRRLDGGSVALVVAELPFKCPAAPYEAALMLEAGFRANGTRSKTQIDLYTPEPQPMPVAGPDLGAALTQVLDQRGIGLHTEQQLTAVDPERRRLTFAGGPTSGEADYDLLLYVPPHRSAAPVQQSALANDAGWIPVDPATLGTAAANVYAIGDTAALPLANGMLLPKAGVFAHEEARVVAKRISASIAGRPASATFSGWGGCFVEMGDGTAAYGGGDFLAPPAPQISLAPARRSWRWGKVGFERAWLTAISASPRKSRLAWRALDMGPGILEQRWLWRWL